METMAVTFYLRLMAILMAVGFSRQQVCPQNCATVSGTSCYYDDVDRRYECLHGCISDGYYGEICQKCRTRCISCTGFNACTICVTGNWGGSCGNTCSANCAGNICRKSNGECSEGCIDGFYGSYCNSPCRPNCKNCTGWNSCDECKKGYYSSVCHVLCPYYCVNQLCDKDSGTCSEGICNQFGTTQTCPCPSNCKYGSCNTNNGHCSNGCLDGFFGDTCTSVCRANCNSCGNYNDCWSCKDGFHGELCGAACSTNCLNTRCEKDDGRCSLGCVSGYHGNQCNETCSVNCKITCDRDTGNCIYGCKNNAYFGNNCEFACATNCVGGVCDPSNGQCPKCPANCVSCTSGSYCASCIRGWYGQTCSMNCPAGCLNEACEQNNGVCSNGCKPGPLFGIFCEACPENCLTCSSASQCSSCKSGYKGTTCQSLSSCPSNCETCTSLDLCTECTDGYYGNVCNQSCSENCARKACYQNSGACIDGCVLGFHGSSCAESCPENCTACSSETRCSSCALGHHGITCQNMCPAGCNETCSSSTGKCYGNCNPGFSGYDYCDKRCNNNCYSCYFNNVDRCHECQVGYYGVESSYLRCDRTCSPNCNGNLCQKIDGECLLGCTPGFHGHTCMCPDRCDFCQGSTCQSCNTNDGWYVIGRQCSCKMDPCLSRASGTQMCTSCNDSTWFPERVACCKCFSIDPNCLECVKQEIDGTSIECTSCVTGWYLSSGTCQPCSQFCAGKTCSNMGVCSSCVGGRYGEFCDKECIQNCEVCEQQSGDCMRCKAGLYGSQCNRTCSEACQRDENGMSLCSVTTGVCELGCRDKTTTGSMCEQECSKTCTDRLCEQTSGNCSSGCVPGYHGNRCEKECNKNCVNETCDISTGVCLSGCVTGFTGDTCFEALTSGEEGGNSSAVAGSAAGAVVALLVIVAVVLGVIFFKRRQNSVKSRKSDTALNANADDDQKGGPIYYNQDTVHLSLREVERPLTASKSDMVDPPTPIPTIEAKANVSTVVKEQKTNKNSIRQEDDAKLAVADKDSAETYYNVTMIRRPVSLAELYSFVKNKSLDEYRKEFGDLPKGLVQPHEASRKPNNASKNRYKEIYPYDKNRVILMDGGEDYINASYLDGYNAPKAYIAALGPIVNTISDFWRMVWQEEVGRIVMLTNLCEAGIKKCEQYWPDKGTDSEYGNIRVVTEAEDFYADFCLRQFGVMKGDKKRRVTHIHYITWPDKGVPVDVTGLVEFRQKVKATQTNLKGPTIVHCSAGIGRTGTYVALDNLTVEGETEGSVDIYGCVQKLREQRVNMVQTQEQYEYLHRAVAHSLTFDCRNVGGDEFQDYLKKMTQPVQGGTTLLQQRFQQLQETIEINARDEESRVANKSYNDKNRKDSVIPADRYRPRLYINMSAGSSDYINAVFINSYRSKDAFIITQTPLKDTVEDFWKLVLQEKAPCIVMLDDSCIITSKNSSPYWPTKQEAMECGAFKITKTKMKEEALFIKNTFSVELQTLTDTGKHEVTQFQCKLWPEGSKTPSACDEFLQLIDEVESHSSHMGGKGPVIVHCLNGAERSGLFCASSILVEKMKIEQDVSVVNTVRQLKSRRPQIIPNLEQYRFCHEVVAAYIESFNTYSNFVLR